MVPSGTSFAPTHPGRAFSPNHPKSAKTDFSSRGTRPFPHGGAQRDLLAPRGAQRTARRIRSATFVRAAETVRRQNVRAFGDRTRRLVLSLTLPRCKCGCRSHGVLPSSP